MNFVDRLAHAERANRSLLCVGLDPEPARFPGAMRGDATLFTRGDEVEGQWAICEPILRAWAELREPLPQYPAGTQGPREARRILLEGHEWRAI